MAASEDFPHRSSPRASPLQGLQARRGAGAAGVQPPRPRFLGEGKAASTPGFLHANTRGTQAEPQVEWKRGWWRTCSQWLGFPSPSILHNRGNAPVVTEGWGHQAKKKIPPTGHNPLNYYYFFHSAMKPRIQSANGGHFEQPRAGHPHTPSQSLPGQAPISSAGES